MTWIKKPDADVVAKHFDGYWNPDKEHSEFYWLNSTNAETDCGGDDDNYRDYGPDTFRICGCNTCGVVLSVEKTVQHVINHAHSHERTDE